MSTPDLPRPEPDGEDIDAEFARMMEGLDLEDPAGASPDASDDASADAGPDAEPELTVEAILGAAGTTAAAGAVGGADETDRPIALVATSVASAQALAGAIRLRTISRDDASDVIDAAAAHGTEAGAVVVAELGEDAAHRLAALVSESVGTLGVILFWRRGERTTATRYRGGERGDDVSPALVLGGLDRSVEQVMLGALGPDDLGEGVRPAAMSRMQALKALASGRRRKP